MANKQITLTGQGPVFYMNRVRVPIETGISISETELRSCLLKARELHGLGSEVTPGPSGFTLEDAISNMSRLLSDNPGDVMDWLDNRKPLDSEEFYNLMQVYRHTPIGDQEAAVKAFEDVKTFVKNKFSLRV